MNSSSTLFERADNADLTGRFHKRFTPLLSLLLLWGILLAWSLIRCPIPSVNEPHYLTKAKHFWDPTWCARDFFLTSSNPHQFFYLAIGWLTRFVSLETTALIGRFLGLFVFALGWGKLARTLLPNFGGPHFALSLFLLLQASVNFSGEWVIGGIESKVPSYGFGLWALAAIIRSHRLRAGLLLGLAVAFHPLVGLWLCLALLFAALPWAWRNTDEIRPAIQKWLPPAILLLLVSLPGLWPAFMVLLEETTPQIKFAGNFLQIYYRLKHHLDPMEFAWWRYYAYGFFLMLMLLSYRRLGVISSRSPHSDKSPTVPVHLLMAVTLAATLFASVGVVLGLRFGEPAEMLGLAWRMRLLKFYPFRLFDLILPITLSLFLTAILGIVLRRLQSMTNEAHRWRKQSMMPLMALVLLSIGFSLPFADHNPSRMSPAMKSDWLDVCRWARANTAPDALFSTTGRGWAFKWFAQRAEFVTHKDCPQEAAGIVEWHRRLALKRAWGRECYEDSLIDARDLQRLADETGADYYLTMTTGNFSNQPIYENRNFRVFRLTDPPPLKQPLLEQELPGSRFSR